MIELHRLTLRQINENPTLMSDEVFVPQEEVDALLRELEAVRQELRRLDAKALEGRGIVL